MPHVTAQPVTPSVKSIVDKMVRRIVERHDPVRIILFGSRARGTAKRYSDYDIGVFRTHPLEFPTFSRLLDRVGANSETK